MLYAAAGVHRLADQDAALPASEARVARIAVHRSLDAAAADWLALQAEAAISPYQTLAWQQAWIATRGLGLGVEPFIVVAYDGDGLPLVLLPLGLYRRGPASIAGFLGGRDSNANLGLFRPGTRWTTEAVAGLLRAATRQAGGAIDLFVLRNQPHGWGGAENPLRQLPSQPSPSFGYKAVLQRDPDRFFRATLSKEGRKKLRRKAEKLAEIGPVEHRVARTAAEARAMIDAFERQRRERCAMQGLSAADLADQVAFLKQASIAEADHPSVEIHALLCDDRVLATFGGTTWRGRFCGMVISFDAASDLARMSPGDLLVAAVIRDKCRAGLDVFDLGIGEARYKFAFCPDPEPLFDTLLPVSPLGSVIALTEALRLRGKRWIKQSTWAWPMLRGARRTVRRLMPAKHRR